MLGAATLVAFHDIALLALRILSSSEAFARSVRMLTTSFALQEGMLLGLFLRRTVS